MELEDRGEEKRGLFSAGGAVDAAEKKPRISRLGGAADDRFPVPLVALPLEVTGSKQASGSKSRSRGSSLTAATHLLRTRVLYRTMSNFPSKPFIVMHLTVPKIGRSAKGRS